MTQAANGSMEEREGARDEDGAPVVALERASVPEAAAEVVAAAPVFYRIDPRRITFAEFRGSASLLTSVIAWIVIKVFRARVPASTDDLPIARLGDFAVAGLDAALEPQFGPIAAELTAAGFHSAAYHSIDDHLHATGTYMVSFAHSSLPVVARIHCRVWAAHTPARSRLFTEFITAFADGGCIWTLSSPFDLHAPPTCRIIRRTGASATDLLRAHRDALAAEPSGRRALPVRDAAAVAEVCERLHTEVRDFHLRRGVFAPTTADDEAQRSRNKTSRRDAVAGGSKYPDVLAELERLQTPRAGWRGGLLILVLSLAVFLMVGLPGQVSFLRLLAIVPILLFHEYGHYLSMQMCGYRNLRMFFIPGFGAAVTGRHFNVPGWKRAIVSLAGPVPGLLIGIIVGLCGIVWGSTTAIQAGFLIVVLNGFNLLPVLPLDGGHVLHALLFSRHYVLDAVFRVGAAVALFALALALHTRLLTILAVLMLLSIPYSLRTARAVRDLRRAGFTPASADDQTIPPAAAEEIIDRLKAGPARPQANKAIAQQTLQVYEALNTRPPGWLGSVGLGSAYALCLAAAVVFTFVFALAERGSFRGFVPSGLDRSSHTVDAARVRTAGPRATASDPIEIVTLIARFGAEPEAVTLFQGVANRLEAGQKAALLGSIVLIRVAADDTEARERWLAELTPRAAELYVDSEVGRAMFTVTAKAPDEAAARAIEGELDQYFSLPLSERLVAPWSPAGTITPAQAMARRTYSALRSVQTYDDPVLEDLRDRLAEAVRLGDAAAHKSLVEEFKRSMSELEQAAFARIAADPSGAMDAELARRYAAIRRDVPREGFDHAPYRELAPRLGQVAVVNGSPDPTGDRTCARAGHALRTGTRVGINFATFFDPAAGVPALIDWLAARGCSEIRYHILHGAESDPDELDYGEGY